MYLRCINGQAPLSGVVIGAEAIVPERQRLTPTADPIVVPFGGSFSAISRSACWSGAEFAERNHAPIDDRRIVHRGRRVSSPPPPSPAAPRWLHLFCFSRAAIALSRSLLKSIQFDPSNRVLSDLDLSLFDLLLPGERTQSVHTLKDELDIARTDPQKFKIGTITVPAAPRTSPAHCAFLPPASL